MKKLLSLVLATITLLSISTGVMAVESIENQEPSVQYMDFDLNELMGENSIAPFATTAKKDAMASTVSANLFNGGTGSLTGNSATFKFSGIPANAKIKDIQAWNPSKSGISQSRFTGIENIQVIRDGSPSGWFKYRIMPEPTLSYPCRTSTFNGLPVDATYSISIQGTVVRNESGMDGFTVRGTKVRVTYTV